jgi:aminopeptidase N
MPLTIGLLDAGGHDIPLQLAGEASPQGRSRVLSLREQETVFRFVNVPEAPVPSLGRDFSAPVIINYPYGEDDLRLLLSHDGDPFNRWEAGHRLTLKLLLQGLPTISGTRAALPTSWRRRSAASWLTGSATRPSPPGASLPLEVYCRTAGGDRPDAVHRVRLAMRRFRPSGSNPRCAKPMTYEVTGTQPDAKSAGRRALRSLALAYLMI